MKVLILAFFLAALQFADVSGKSAPLDPREDEDIDDYLKEATRSHCYYACHQNPDDCSNEARRDLNTCVQYLYWAYFTNYEACAYDCNRVSHSACEPYVDCSRACLTIAVNKLRQSSKTPDQIIRAYSDLRSQNRKYQYIE